MFLRFRHHGLNHVPLHVGDVFSGMLGIVIELLSLFACKKLVYALFLNFIIVKD